MLNKITVWLRSLLKVTVSLPSIFAALLPKLTCPLCWPMYASVLSTFGISVTVYYQYFLYFMVGFLSITLFSIGYKAQSRRGYGPLVLGVLSSFLILFSKFVLDSNVMLNAAVIFLMVATIWNLLPRRQKTQCISCIAS